jgi:hypothetical protein
MNEPVMRSAHPHDFPFYERLYIAEMGNIITQLGLDMARQWHVAEVHHHVRRRYWLAADHDDRQQSLYFKLVGWAKAKRNQSDVAEPR